LGYENVQKYKKSWDDVLGYNKVAILYGDGRHQIINESGGHWLDGVWFSNYSHRDRATGLNPLYDDDDDGIWERQWRYH
jgi:hypothetical protein